MRTAEQRYPNVNNLNKQSLQIHPEIEYIQVEVLKYLDFVKECLKTKDYSGQKSKDIRSIVKVSYVAYKQLIKTDEETGEKYIHVLKSKYNPSKHLEIIGLRYD